MSDFAKTKTAKAREQQEGSPSSVVSATENEDKVDEMDLDIPEGSNDTPVPENEDATATGSTNDSSKDIVDLTEETNGTADTVMAE